jgi:hypothetical protein
MLPPMVHSSTAVTCHRLGAPLAAETFLNAAVLQQLPTLSVCDPNKLYVTRDPNLKRAVASDVYYKRSNANALFFNTT